MFFSFLLKSIEEFLFLNRLQTLNQEIKVREMQLLDVARRKMLHQQHLLKEAEIHRLDDEIRKKVC
jgi:hypothetical protein